MYMESLRLVFKGLPQIVSVFRDAELQLLFTMLSELQANEEGFDPAFFALRDEVEYRKANTPDGHLIGTGQDMPYS